MRRAESKGAIAVFRPAMLFLLAASAARAEPPLSPEALLRDADRSRGGIETGVTWTVDLEAVEDGVATNRTFLVKARGTDALSEALAPARNKGEIMLFNDRALWFVKPGLRKPVSISARQKLSGMAANGDIASTNYARDYDAVLAGEDLVDGEEAWRLDLKARAKNVTYDRIRYWISKKRRLGLKAEFLTVSGDLFKTATFAYGNRMTTGGVEFDFVSRMVIADAAAAANVTTLRFSAPKAEEHAPSIFNVNNLAR